MTYIYKMKNLRFVKTVTVLAGAASLTLLAGCSAAPDPTPALPLVEMAQEVTAGDSISVVATQADSEAQLADYMTKFAEAFPSVARQPLQPAATGECPTGQVQSTATASGAVELGEVSLDEAFMQYEAFWKPLFGTAEAVNNGTLVTFSGTGPNSMSVDMTLDGVGNLQLVASSQCAFDVNLMQ